VSRNWKIALVALALIAGALLVLIGVVVLWPMRPVQPQGATPSHARSVAGLVRDVITAQAITGAQVRTSLASVITDESGSFTIPLPAGEALRVSAANYEEQAILPAADTVLIELVRDPRATYELIHTYQMQHEYGRQYDLLHPDVQARFSRDDFVRYMEATVDYEIVARSYGAPVLLSTWTFDNRTYSEVAQVPFALTIRRAGQDQTQNSVGYLVRAQGTWRWFREPLSQPTVTPSSQPSFPVGSWVQVTAGNLNVRAGPGAGYGIVATVAYGTRLRILAGPNLVDNTPWYQVTDESAVQGWCNGTYLTLAAPPMPTAGPWFPVGSWVLVASPDGTLNIRQGPGAGYAVVAVTYTGARLRVVGGPVLVDNAPWYEVVDEAQTWRGWCAGRYLTPGSPPPSATPTPTQQPNFPPGTWVLAAGPDGQLHVRSGPGNQYAILRMIPNGTLLRIVQGPTWADNVPWYLVTDTGQTFQGWANGLHLVLAPIPTATPTGPSVTTTPTSGPYFPVGSWVRVQSPDGQLNLRQGPGMTYPVVYVAHNGQVFRIAAGPTWVQQVPWYEVVDPAGTISGWCNGLYLVPDTPTPTVPSGQPRFTELQFCVIPAGGGAADCSGNFRHPIYEVYIVWDYENMRPGLTVRRVWYFNNQHLRTVEDQWDYARYGAQGTVWDVRLQDSKGIAPGVYRLELYLNNVRQQERSFTISY